MNYSEHRGSDQAVLHNLKIPFFNLKVCGRHNHHRKKEAESVSGNFQRVNVNPGCSGQVFGFRNDTFIY